MKISTILDHIDNGHLAPPEFQRGCAWNGEQVRGLFASLYERHPVGSLYGVIRGQAPAFFEGNQGVFTDLRFHLDEEVFELYQPLKMRDNPHWIDISALFRDGVPSVIAEFAGDPNIVTYVSRLTQLQTVTEIDLYIEEITGENNTLGIVVDIFNRVNSGGTKLSKGDLALAKIVVDWPEGRQVMRNQLKVWEDAGFSFTMDWLLRSINTVITGKARFVHLHDVPADTSRNGFERATTHINDVLNMISSRLGLDHTQVLFGRFAIPVMVHYLDRRAADSGGAMNFRERDKLLFWYVEAAMWGRYSGSSESVMDQDLTALAEGGLDQLLQNLRLWLGSFGVSPGNFAEWSRLEVHYVFPRSLLYRSGHRKAEVNAMANYCSLTKDTDLTISNRTPEELLHGETHWLDGPAAPVAGPTGTNIATDGDAKITNQNTGDRLAVLDLAWPHGLQEELSEPVALITDSTDRALAYASQAGYRCFRDISSLKLYVKRQMGGEEQWARD